jgi:Fe-S-cluster containining protein
MKFVCTQCGRCCMNFGQHMTVERRLSSRDYYCTCLITRESFYAHVQSEYSDAFTNRPDPDIHPSWCPFLRREDTGHYICTIHDTAPRFCRDYRCFTMLITDVAGKEVGRVKGRRSLETADPRLMALWETGIPKRDELDDRALFLQMGAVLKAAGYHIELVE